MKPVIEALERTPVIVRYRPCGFAKRRFIGRGGAVSAWGAGVFITVSDDIKAAKQNGKFVFIHIDLADGIGKDKAGIHWLKTLGADGIISTRTQLIRAAHDSGLLAVQRFFILDSKGMHSISETIENTRPDLIEIMPGVIPKALKAVAAHKIPVIAGGLIETKQEVTAALSANAIAVSTGKKELWNEI